MTSPFTYLREIADPHYAQQVDSVLKVAQDLTSDPELSFVDVDDVVGSVARYCLSGRLSGNGQINLVAALMQLVWWCALPIFERDYKDLTLIVRRSLQATVQNVVRAPIASKKAPRHHLVICGPMISLLHSPTLGAIDYARAITDRDPEAKITFVMLQHFVGADIQGYVDQVFSHHSEKPSFKDANVTSTIAEILLSTEIIIIHVFGANALDPRLSELAKIYPVVMFMCGDVPAFQYADVYWHQQSEDYIRDFWRRCGVPEMYITNYSGGAPCTSAVEDIEFSHLTKSDIGYSEAQTILVTVGNRLAVDITEEFLSGMIQILSRNSDLVWLIVGAYDADASEALENAFKGRIKHIPYAHDLLPLLSATDIFVNPFRKGGGGSALSAMRAGSIVLTRTEFGDVASLTPFENGAESAEAFFERLADLCTSAPLREAYLERQNARLAHLTDQSALSRAISEYVTLAQKRFKRRKSQGIDFLADA